MKKIVKIITSGALALAIIFVAAACSGSESGDSAEKKTLRIGVFSDKAPFGYLDANGNYAGYDVEFGNRIAKDYGAEVEYVPTEASARVDSLVGDKVDIVLANFTVTEERAEKVDFTLPYQQVTLGIVSPKDAQIDAIDQLKDKELIVIKGTTAETYFEKNYPEIKLQKYDQYAEAQQAMLAKRGAAWANDNTEVFAFAKEAPDFVVPAAVSSLGDADFIAAAVKKGNTELYKWLNEEIVKLGEENFFHNDYNATLASIYGADAVENIVVEGGQTSSDAIAQKPWYGAISEILETSKATQ